MPFSFQTCFFNLLKAAWALPAAVGLCILGWGCQSRSICLLVSLLDYQSMYLGWHTLNQHAAGTGPWPEHPGKENQSPWQCSYKSQRSILWFIFPSFAPWAAEIFSCSLTASPFQPCQVFGSWNDLKGMETSQLEVLKGHLNICHL